MKSKAVKPCSVCRRDGAKAVWLLGTQAIPLCAECAKDPNIMDAVKAGKVGNG